MTRWLRKRCGGERGNHGSARGARGSSSNAGGSVAAGNGSGGTGSDSVGGSVGSGGTTTVPGDVPTEALLPARIRRLTTAEYAATVQSLLGVDVPEGVSLPPDTRQDGFTRNESQPSTPVLVNQLDASAQALPSPPRAASPSLLRAPTPPAAKRAPRVIESFGARAFAGRSPVKSSAWSLSHTSPRPTAPTTRASSSRCVRCCSPWLHSVTELGDGSGGDRVQLTSHELAKSSRTW